MIERHNPSIGLNAEDVYADYGFTAVITTDTPRKTIYFSGLVPIRNAGADSFENGMANLEIVGVGDIRAQMEWTLELIRRQLEAVGATFQNLVSTTVYTTNIAGVMECADVFRRTYGGYPPTTNLIGVHSLFHPDVMLEITGVAVLE